MNISKHIHLKDYVRSEQLKCRPSWFPALVSNRSTTQSFTLVRAYGMSFGMRVCLCLYVCVCLCLLVCVSVYVCVHVVRAYVCLCLFQCTCLCVRACSRVHTCLCVCICVCVCVCFSWCVCAHAHTQYKETSA